MASKRRTRTIRQRQDALLKGAESILLGRMKRLQRIDDSRQAERYLRVRLAGLAREELHALWLDQHYRVIDCDVIAIGSADHATVEPRVLLQSALQRNARSAILAHNHPSGDDTPSHGDIALTARLAETLRMIDVELLDHLVIGRSEAYSFNEAGLLRDASLPSVPKFPRRAALRRAPGRGLARETTKQQRSHPNTLRIPARPITEIPHRAETGASADQISVRFPPEQT